MGFAGDSRDQRPQLDYRLDLPGQAGGLDVPAQPEVSGREQQQQPPPLTIWAHRLSLVIMVVFCVELGMLLVVLPWTKVWTENSLLAAYPALNSAPRNEFTRGSITGLGLVNIWIGIWEAVQYRDPGKRRASFRLP